MLRKPKRRVRAERTTIKPDVVRVGMRMRIGVGVLGAKLEGEGEERQGEKEDGRRCVERIVGFFEPNSRYAHETLLQSGSSSSN